MSDLGDLLRRARAHKGVTLRDAEKRTRISRTYLAALEAHDFDQLPPRAYARGIVRNYAQYLGLDPAAVLAMYEQAMQEDWGSDSEDVEVVAAVQPIEIHGHWAPNFAIIIFMLVISAIIFTWIYSAYLQPSNDDIPDTLAQPTATPVEQSLLDLLAQTPTPAELDEADVTEQETEGAGDIDATEAPLATPSADETAAAADEDTTADDQDDADGIEDVTDAELIPAGVQQPPGYYWFAVYAEAEVWVHVTLDGDNVALDRVLAAGEIEVFLAQSARVTSGNAANVRVYVDGVDQGTLGEPWDAVITYP